MQPALFRDALLPVGERVERLLEASGFDPGEVAKRIRVTGVARRRVDDTVFRIAADAVLGRKRLSFSYRSRSRPGDDECRRIVSPQRLVHYRGRAARGGFKEIARAEVPRHATGLCLRVKAAIHSARSIAPRVTTSSTAY